MKNDKLEENSSNIYDNTNYELLVSAFSWVSQIGEQFFNPEK